MPNPNDSTLSLSLYSLLGVCYHVTIPYHIFGSYVYCTIICNTPFSIELRVMRNTFDCTVISEKSC